MMRRPNILTGIFILLSTAAVLAGDAVDEYRKACEKDLADAEKIFRSLEEIEGEKSIASVLKPLNEMERILGNSAGKASLF